MSKKMLVVYYSWTNGNTEKIAKSLAAAYGADIEQIDTVVPYPDDYDTTVSQGQDEVNAGFKPAIKALAHNASDYDVIAVGTPTWWYTMAPAVSTFFAQTDWSGKTLVPFMTNGGWPGHAIEDMKTTAAGASFGPALEVRFDSAGGPRQETPQADIDAWIESVGALLG